MYHLYLHLTVTQVFLQPPATHYLYVHYIFVGNARMVFFSGIQFSQIWLHYLDFVSTSPKRNEWCVKQIKVIIYTVL
jgi:hypothetical protein